MLKLKRHTVFTIVNIEKSEYTKFEATVSRNSLYYNRPSDRVRKKNQKLCGNFQAYYAEEYVDYVENTLDYAEI